MLGKLSKLYTSLQLKCGLLSSLFAGLDTPVGRMRRLEMERRACERRGDLERAESLSRLLGEMEEYRALLEQLLKEKHATPTKEEAAWMLAYFRDLVEETATEVDLHLGEYVIFYAWCKEKAYFSLTEEVSFLTLLIRGYCKEGHGWRARPYVGYLKELLCGGVSEETVALFVDAHDALATFYREVHDVRGAFSHLVKQAELLFDTGEIEESAYVLERAYALSHTLPELVEKLLGDDAISRRYGEYAHVVLRYHTPRGLKVDPVEHTAPFLAMYDEVMEWVEERYPDKGFGSCHMIWSLMTEGFAACGILWRSPAVMNPHARFD